MDQDYLIKDFKREETDREARKVLTFRPRKPLWREYVETAIIALVAAGLPPVFVVSAYKVTSSSLETAFLEGAYIFVTKLSCQ